MKLKAKKILSLVLAMAMILSLFCIVPSVSSSAATETSLYASTYGTLVNYSVSADQKTSDGAEALVGGISNAINDNMQTYASMVANGFTDTKFPSYVTYRVKAETAGTYTLKMRIAPGGSVGSGYFVVMGINDKNFYKADVATTGTTDVSFTVELEKGINLVRCFTRVGETQSLIPSGAWVNFDSLIIPSTLTGMLKGAETKFAAQAAQYRKYDASGTTNLGGAGSNFGELETREYTHETIKIGDVWKIPYLSFTVTVPESGYYDMAFTMNTSGTGEGYINAFVDATKYKLYYKNVDSWSGKNVSLYIPAGTHNITFTNVWGYTAGGSQHANGYTNWCDFGELLIRNGDVTLAETAIDPKTISDPTRLEAGVDGQTFKFSQPTQAGNQASGGTQAGNIGFDTSKGLYSTELADVVDKSNVANITYVVNAPAAGTYTVKPGYFWSAPDTAKNVYLVVNDHDVYEVPFSKMGTSNWNATSADVTLDKGTNIIRFIPFTRDYNTDKGYINADYLDIDARLTKGGTAMTKIEAESLQDINISKFGNKNGTVTDKGVTYGAVTGASNGGSNSIWASTASFSTLSAVPFVSLTVNAPADGWYDITASIASGATWADETNAYVLLAKDGAVEARAFRPSTGNAKFVPPDDTNNTADRCAVDLTTYLTEGEHTIAMTSLLPYDESVVVADGNLWIDVDGFFLGQGLTLADNQVELSFDDIKLGIQDASFINYYQTVFTSNKDCGFESEGFFPHYQAGNVRNNFAAPFDKLSNAIPASTTPYVAFAIDAPADGSYPIKIRFNIGCQGTPNDESGRNAELAKYVTATGENPFAAVVVANGDDFAAHKLNYAPQRDGVLQSNWWYTGIISANLKKGANVLYLVAPTKELRDYVKGVYVDYGAISMPSELALADVDLTMVGDANGDKCVDIKDILRMKKYLSNGIAINQGVDFDNNGTVNSNDLTTMTKLISKPSTVGQHTLLKVNARNANGKYTVTRSNPDSHDWMITDVATVKTSRTSGKTNIDVSTSTITSNFSGFGASLTDTVAQNMAMLSNEQLDAVMTDLFTPSGDNLGLSWLRQPVGGSDFANPIYSYNDIPQGQTDTDLSEFSISHDTVAINPTNKLAGYGNVANGKSMMDLLKMAKTKSGNTLSFMAAAWSAPLWMKTRWTWHTTPSNGTSSLNTAYYGVYAEYFYKYLQAYKDHGIDIEYLSPQNEPSGQHGITSMYFSSTMMKNFVVDYLSGKINSYNSTFGKSVKLLGWDFNPHIWAKQEFLDSTMRGYYGAVGFHAYGGSAESPLDFGPLKTYGDYFHSAGKKAFVTEAAGNTSSNSFKDIYTTNLVTYWNMPKNYFCNTNRTTSALRNGADGFIYWNIMLDEERGPVDAAGGGNSWGTGLMGFNRKANDYYHTDDYYALAHYSKFIRKGANILSSTNTSSAVDFSGLNNVVAQNTDGSYVMVINNDTNYVKEVSINTGLGYYIEYAVPGRSTVTLKWTKTQLQNSL